MTCRCPCCRAIRPVTAKYGNESQFFDLDVRFLLLLHCQDPRLMH